MVTSIKPLHNENGKNNISMKIKQKIKKTKNNFLSEGLSPCPWADYLKCIPHTISSVDDVLHEAKFIMKDKNQIGGASINSFMSSLSSVVELSKKVETQVDKIHRDTQDERTQAAAAITYITRLFVLGLEDDIDDLKTYTKNRHNKEISDVIYEMALFVKNTKSDN
jgi:hypothetical protein